MSPLSEGLPSSDQSSPMQKLGQKLIKEPLIPIGCVLTVSAFLSAARAVRKGDHHQAQRMFRARVIAQGFTILAVVGGGIYLADDRKKERQQWALERQQKQQADTQKWIRELEARDAEEKALQERITRRRELRKVGGASKGATEQEEAAAEAELEAQLAAADAREAATAARATGQPSGGGVISKLGGMFGGSSGSKKTESPSSPETAKTTAVAAATTAANSEDDADSEESEPKKGARKSHGRSQLDTLGDLFSKKGGSGSGGSSAGDEKK
ncbi:Respiratory supercomplex factor 1, mitochondrial [Sporothrix epigloea]|uniref:Respiratory supercomplex factor 1, mitochondrial n=1 Tax=Sporothrix epigloea TaxID=1892477 RepID=A0ABP0E090_9PEZI